MAMGRLALFGCCLAAAAAVIAQPEPARGHVRSSRYMEVRDGTRLAVNVYRPLRAAVAQHAANTPMAAQWYAMPFRDSVSPHTGTAFWDEVGPYPYLQTIRDAGIATYFRGNLRDEPTSQMILAAANFDGKLLVGPGSHCVPPPDFGLGGEVLRVFDHHLKGIDNGIDREPRSVNSGIPAWRGRASCKQRRARRPAWSSQSTTRWAVTSTSPSGWNRRRHMVRYSPRPRSRYPPPRITLLSGAGATALSLPVRP